VKQKSIQLSRLRYERVSPYLKGKVPRIWHKEELTLKTFFTDLLKDIWKLLKWFKGLYRKELVVGSVLILALAPEPHHVLAEAAPPPSYIKPIARLQPVQPISVAVPAEATPVPEPAPVAPPVAVVASVAAPTGDAKSYALSLVGSSQFSCLDSLWTKESGWNPYAVNSIGAIGIPQALGHGQVFALGDWKAQVDWGLNYISTSYGTPCAAWAHSVAVNWY
jgi:hypothetical protein